MNKLSDKRQRWYLAAWALIFLTLAAFLVLPGHQPVATLLDMRDLQLTREAGTRSTYWRRTFTAEAGQLVTVSTRAEWAHVAPGAEPWQVARVDVVGLRDGKWHWFPGSTVVAVEGNGTATFSQTLRLPEGYRVFTLEASLDGATGSLHLQGLRVSLVQPASITFLVRHLLLLGWLVLGFSLCLVSYRAAPGILAAGLACVALLLLLPETHKDRVLAALGPVGDCSIDHFMMFAGVTALLARRLPAREVLLMAGTMAAASETWQFFTTHREPGWLDLTADGLGILTALAVIRLVNGRPR